MLKNKLMYVMKKNISIAFILSFIFTLTVFTGCEEDNKEFEDMEVTAVKVLLEPTDNKQVDLKSSGNLVFKWEEAEARDGSSLVYYDVLFDKAGGNFSAPVYIRASDNKSLAASASFTPAVLDEIAEAAGAEAGHEVTLAWTVRSNRGVKTALAEQSRTLTIIRKTASEK